MSPAIAAMVPSSSPPTGNSGLSSGIETQAITVATNTGASRFSGVVQAGGKWIAARAAAGSKLSSWIRWTLAIISAASGTPSSTTGTP